MAYESSKLLFFTPLVLLSVLRECGGQRNWMVLEDPAEMLDRVLRQRFDLSMVFNEFQRKLLPGLIDHSIPLFNRGLRG
jgi:hypothetical protein